MCGICEWENRKKNLKLINMIGCMSKTHQTLNIMLGSPCDEICAGF